MLKYQLQHSRRSKRDSDWLAKVKGEKAKADPVDPNEPQLIEDAYWLWSAFIVLSSQRQFTSHGPQPITVCDVRAYAEISEVEQYDQEFLLNMISKMDHEYLTDAFKKLEQERKKSQRSKKGR